jgi:CheY-like chemotaxis protein
MVMRRVMIVDDSADAVALMAIVLQMMGHTTAVAKSGEDALTLAKTFKPEVAFLDIGMPGMDGFDLAAALLAADSSANIVLIALTGYNDRLSILRSQAAGFHKYITKPAAYEQIIAAMALPLHSENELDKAPTEPFEGHDIVPGR